MQQKSLSRWSQVGDQNGFITVFPDGVDNAWNAGLCCADDTSIDDVAFVRDAIKALQADACIDPLAEERGGAAREGAREPGSRREARRAAAKFRRQPRAACSCRRSKTC